MNQIFDCQISDNTLDKIAEVFVATKDVLYFDDDDIANACLQRGIPVYTRQEFRSTFPLFALNYGSVYHLWAMKFPEEVYVLMVEPSELRSLPGEFQTRLLTQQVRQGRGHIYISDWLAHFDVVLPHSIDVDGKSYGSLTWGDWQALSAATRRQWILRWLTEWRKGEAEGVQVRNLGGNQEGISYELVQEYAGTFGPTGTANCFAAAIAMVVGAWNPKRARVLINRWIHQGPFFRILEGQGYRKHADIRVLLELVFRPTDVLVWYNDEGIANHAGYAVTESLIFQKQGQGWDNPWQVLKVGEVWYNSLLKIGGYIEIYRQRPVS